jgi:hypothetical protein
MGRLPTGNFLDSIYEFACFSLNIYLGPHHTFSIYVFQTFAIEMSVLFQIIKCLFRGDGSSVHNYMINSQL